MNRLRVAVAGVGSFSQRVLIPGLLACPDAELVAVFGPTPAKTERLARERGIPRWFSDYARMLDEMQPQAVVVATPNDVHHAMALAAIERGLAVLCEKPLGVDVRQAREMAAAARAAGVPTAVNFTYRSTNPMRHVERLLRQGRVGQLYHFSISFWQNIRADPGLPLAYRMLRERGGGALLDIGVHMMDLVRWLLGDVAAVCGATHTAIATRPVDAPGDRVATPASARSAGPRPRERVRFPAPAGPPGAAGGAGARDGGRGTVTADDTASIVVRLASGVAGTIQVSQVASGRQNYRRLELFGSEGSLVMEEDRAFGPEVRLARPGDVAYTLEPPPADVEVAFDDFPRFHLTRIVAALRGDSTDWPAFDDGLKAQIAAEAVEESARTGRWVEV